MTHPKLCRHRGQSLGYVTLNGREHYLGHWPAASRRPPAAVQAAFDELIGRWLANGRRLPADDPTPPTSVNDVILAFVRYASGHYAKRRAGKDSAEVEGIKAACRVVRAAGYGSAPAAEFGPKCLKDVRAKMVAADWSRSYVNVSVNRIKRMFRWATAEEMVPPSVVHGLSAVAAIRRGEPGVRETAKVRPAPDADVDAALPFMPAAVSAMVRLQRAAGMRPFEVTVLRGCDIDRSGPVWVYRPAHHKKEHLDHDRPIYIGPRGQAVLSGWLRDDPDEYLFSPLEAEAARNAARTAARKTPRWQSHMARNRDKRVKKSKRPRGAVYTPDSYRRAITVACEKAGVPAWAPNRLRHSAATDFRKQFGIEVTRVLLGHSSLSTSEVYAEVDSTAAAAAALKAG
jgi:integrase